MLQGMFVEYSLVSSLMKAEEETETARLVARIGLVTSVKNGEKVCRVQWFERCSRREANENLPVRSRATVAALP